MSVNFGRFLPPIQEANLSRATENLQEWRNSDGTAIARVDIEGRFHSNFAKEKKKVDFCKFGF